MKPHLSPGPVTLGAGVLAVLFAVVVAINMFGGEPDAPPACGKHLHLRGSDCLGVSDGTDVFMPQVPGMRQVFELIAEQNKAVADRKHATVALLVPLQSDNPAVQRQILSEVQGAHLAQARANGADAAKPPIRLVLANPGLDYRHWRVTVDELVEREPDLRVVAGFNLSLRDTYEAMQHVTRTLKIPAVASLVTASDFANPEDSTDVPFPGLARAIPTSEKQAEALLRFDPGLAGAETALVADLRPHDSYNEALRKAFTRARDQGDEGTGVQDMIFHSPGMEEPGLTPNEFEDFAVNICQSNARVVYFAGRAFHLEIFIKKLAGAYCREKRSYTVITGSSATTLDQRLDTAERALLNGDPGAGKPSVSVLYTAPAHPDAWTFEIAKWTREAEGKDAQPPRHLTEPQDAMNALRQDIADQAGAIGPVSLDDGRTIMTHDVVLLASKELARAANTSGAELPSTDRIRKDLGKLNSELRVVGAGGWTCLTNAGNPYDKAVPLVRLDPAARQLTLVGVAWPEGHPPHDDCVVPANPQ
ncbi:amino acid ABC transporter substrate-binding protein [Streptomyces sp. 4N124]|uniref:amino acid ABC transporter substrate-binding protein n=1 Tax=Streptomyces sp. 4N124 TaxID=3457420 RepID=UPI003FD1B24A